MYITCLWNNHSSDILKAKIFESQTIKKSLRARTPKGLKRIAKVSLGHLFLREENLSFNNNYMI
jgi:hypothetical protein